LKPAKREIRSSQAQYEGAETEAPARGVMKHHDIDASTTAQTHRFWMMSVFPNIFIGRLMKLCACRYRGSEVMAKPILTFRPAELPKYHLKYASPEAIGLIIFKHIEI
jgi:hypothetical protein